MKLRVWGCEVQEIQLMGHIVAGFPNFEASLECAKGICLGGADFLEVQFPFSDPNADGVVIANACEESLRGGFNTDLGFELIYKLKEDLHTRGRESKILIMTYGNILFAYGVEKFLNKARDCGVFGLIVPDLSLQNDEGLFKKAQKFGLENIALIAPCTSPKRIRKLTAKSGSFVYVVARNGITGEQTQISPELFAYLSKVKKDCPKPLALGFGIRTKKQVNALRGIVPIVVIGSAFVQQIQNLKDKGEVNYKQAMQDFTQNLMS